MGTIMKVAIGALAVFVVGRAAAQSGSDIRGKLIGISTGKVCLVSIGDLGLPEHAIDSGSVINGLFELKGSIVGAQVMKIVVSINREEYWYIPGKKPK